MGKERRRKRRGRRRGRPADQPTDKPAPEGQQESQEEALFFREESEAPGILPWRLVFRRRRARAEARKQPPGAKAPRPTSHVGISPLSFWRRSQLRSYRREPPARHTWGRTWQRIRRMYFPPWVPVVVIILMVIGILGFLFYTRETTGAPRIGDHWHASYEITICGEKQPPAPQWEGGVHTHGDGIIHIHPQVPAEEGAGARLVKWFEYGGGKLTQTEMRIPGQKKTWKNGDKCEDGREGVLQVYVNGKRMDNWSRYIPHDGDRIRIVFGPEEAAEEGVGIVIPPEEATREITIEAGDQGNPQADSFFNPDTFTISTDETVKVNVKNTGTVTHNLRIEGIDKEYETDDDFVTRPLLIKPGDEGFTVVRIDQPGQYAFRCDIHRNIQFGTVIVTGASGSPSETPTAEATASPQ